MFKLWVGFKQGNTQVQALVGYAEVSKSHSDLASGGPTGSLCSHLRLLGLRISRVLRVSLCLLRPCACVCATLRAETPHAALLGYHHRWAPLNI